MVLRFALIIFGWFVPIHIGWNTPRTKGLNTWELYVENSWRNPTPYLRGVFKQPIPEDHPNPDHKVRTDKLEYAERTMVSGPYIEYWTLEMNDDSRWFKDHPYWETRIGWKFVDGDDTFWPTIQFGPRK
jgi:hypothetical protein